MIINENILKGLFKKENLIKNFIINFLFLIFIICFSVILIINMYTIIYQKYIDIISDTSFSYNINISDSSNEYKDILNKCLSISCERIVFKNKSNTNETRYYIYKVEHDLENMYHYLKLVDDEIFDTVFFTKYLTNELRLVIYYDSVMYILNDNAYIISLLQSVFIFDLLFIVIIFIYNMYSSYYSFKNNIYEQKKYKTYIENKLQGNVTEMIHHEINAPLSILMSTYYIIKDIINNNTKLSKDDIEKILESYNYSINRINDITAFLAKNKYFKREDNVSLYKAFEYVINNINSTHIIKLGIDYQNYEEMLNSFIIHKKLGHTGFMNIINILFNNSIEAGANLITISIVENSKYFITLDIKDNGMGIRDLNGKLFKNSNNIITQYGYSTKNNKGEQLKNKGIIYKILKLFKINLINNDSTRGIGLYMCRVLLEKANGNINLLTTSDEGTTFRLLLPAVKKNVEV